jgi:hypothetical protein
VESKGGKIPSRQILGIIARQDVRRIKKEIQLEIAHVLFIDIVGYQP